MENRPQFYQGDVLLEYVNDSQPAESLKGSEGRLVIARGERTGHAHTIDSEDVALSSDRTQLWVVNPTEMTHPEHSPLMLKCPGMYAITLQRRYTPETIERVVD